MVSDSPSKGLYSIQRRDCTFFVGGIVLSPPLAISMWHTLSHRWGFDDQLLPSRCLFCCYLLVNVSDLSTAAKRVSTPVSTTSAVSMVVCRT